MNKLSRNLFFIAFFLSHISFNTWAFDAQVNIDYDRNQRRAVPENNPYSDINAKVQLNPCVLNPGQCSCVAASRKQICENAYNKCNTVYYGNGNSGNRYEGISKEAFKADVADCVSKMATCVDAIVNDHASCCCKDSDQADVRPTLGENACAKASTNMDYYCKKAVSDCQLFSDSIQERENFTTTGLHICAYYAHKCHQWSATKSQRCSCGQNQ